MGRKSFLQGAIVLGIAGVVVKLLGAFFRIPLANMIGDEGMGYYQAAYPIYVLLLVISTAGIPTAISKLVAEKAAIGDRYGAHRVFKISFVLLFVTGIVTSAILFLGAPIIIKLIKNEGAYYAMLAVAPALLFVPIMASYRGYFQGLQDMKPTAISQIIEQLGRVVVGFGLAYYLLSKGKEMAAAGASFGAAAGAIVGSIAVIGMYMKRKKGIEQEILEGQDFLQESARSILYKIFLIAVPITIGASIMPIMNMIDVAIVMRRLQAAGFSPELANGLYGQLSGMAAPIINFPQVLTMGLAMSLVPAISDAVQREDREYLHDNIKLGTRMAMIIGLPCAVGIFVLSKPIMTLLYPLQKASALNAASSLSILAIGLIFLSLVQTLTGVLQGLGKPSIPVINLLIGGVLKVVATYLLTGIPSINVRGAAFGTAIAYCVAALLNLWAIKKYTKTQFDIKITLIKPLIASIVMGVVVWLSFKIMVGIVGSSLATLVAIAIGALVFAVMLVATKSLTYDEFMMLPKGDKVAKLLLKLKILKK